MVHPRAFAKDFVGSMPKHNERYFFDEDPMALFQVEDQLFKVHQYHLARESERFREIFAKHYEAGKNQTPIELPGVTVPEFETLLDYFYKPHVAKKAEDLLDLLSIFHRFQMSTPFQHAKKRLDKGLLSGLTPLQMLTLGDQYGFEDWTSKAYEQLLNREESLEEVEAIALGFDRLVNLVKTREEQLETKIRSAESQNEAFLNSTSRQQLRGRGAARGGLRRGSSRSWQRSTVFTVFDDYT